VSSKNESKPDIERRGGHHVVKCTAITNAGHRCTKAAKPGGNLCGTHLRAVTKRDAPNPDRHSATGQKIIRLLDDAQVDDLGPRDVLDWLIAVASGHVTETQQTGGEGGTIEVPAKMRDRIAAVNLFNRIQRQTTGEVTDEEEIIESLRSVMGFDE